MTLSCRTAQTLPMIELLLRHGADPFHQDSHGDCALHYAARYGDVQVILCILRDVTSRSQGISHSSSIVNVVHRYISMIYRMWE